MAISFCSAGKSVFFASDSLDKARKKRKKNECKTNECRASAVFFASDSLDKGTQKKRNRKKMSVEHPHHFFAGDSLDKARKKRKK